MSDVAVGNNCLLGRGELYFDRFDTNFARTGERFVGNVTSFGIQPTDTLAEKYSSAEASSPLLVRVNTRRLIEMTAVLDEYTKENLALAFMGDNSTFAQGSTTVSTVNQGVTNPDNWYQIKTSGGVRVRAVSGVVVNRVLPSPLLLVLNTDYKVDAVRGRIYIIPTSPNVSVGMTVTVSCSGAVTSIPTVRAGVSSFIRGFVRFVGKPASGPVWEVEAWDVSISSDSIVGFITDQDFGNMTLKGAVLADLVNNPTEPYFRAYAL